MLKVATHYVGIAFWKSSKTFLVKPVLFMLFSYIISFMGYKIIDSISMPIKTLFLF
jgi:hypothetical protein